MEVLFIARAGHRQSDRPVSSNRRWPLIRRPTLWTVGVLIALAIALIVLLYLDVLEQRLWVFGVAAALVVMVALINFGYRYKWTGFSNKTAWDWLQLLIVPVFIAVGGYLFSDAQQRNSRAIEDDRRQDDAVETYMDQITQFVIDGNLQDPEEGEQVQSLVRARTSTVLIRLGPTRKQYIILFLRDSDLITRGNALVDLTYADLSYARLANKDLSNLQLSSTILNYADLQNADLQYTDLSGADLRNANLSGADLSAADLSNATITEEQLNSTRLLEGATMPDGSKHD